MIHVFSSTGAAYDACQCDAEIKDGDILVIPSEGVVGIADTWPFAITAKRGALHGLVKEYNPDDIKQGYGETVKAARIVADEYGFI